MGFQAKFIESRQPSDYELNVDALATEGYNVILNAAYLQSAVQHEKALRKAITDDQLAHIFPTTTASINMLGEYTFHDEPALITDINELPTVEPRFEQLDLSL